MNPVDHIAALLPHIIDALPAAAAVVIGAIIVSFVLNRALTLLADKTSLTYDTIGPFRRLVRWLVAAAAIVLLLDVFGFSLGGLWAMLATLLGMVAIGFVAVWSVLSNTLCTLIILIFRPFAVGDLVEFAGEAVKGQVVDLNLIYTTLRTDDGCVMQVPNNLFFQKVLKRRHGGGKISLAEQLGAKESAKV